MAATSMNEDGYPMKALNPTEVFEGSLVPEAGNEIMQGQDEAVLAYYGKRQQLKVSAPCP